MAFAALRLHRLFRFAALLAIWALLFPALVPLLHPMAATAHVEAMPLCHMAMGGDHHAPTPDQHKNKPSCPICQTIASLAHGFTPPDVVALAVSQPVSVQVAYEAETGFVSTPTTSAWPHAPPNLV